MGKTNKKLRRWTPKKEEYNSSFIQDFILRMFKKYMSGQSIKAEFEELMEKIKA